MQMDMVFGIQKIDGKNCRGFSFQLSKCTNFMAKISKKYSRNHFAP